MVKSPLQGILDYEREHGIPEGYINYAIAHNKNSAFKKLERNEIALNDVFFNEFGEQLSSKEWFDRFCQAKSILPQGSHPQVNGRELFIKMMMAGNEFDADMYNALVKLSKSGKFKIGAITNNYVIPDELVELKSSGVADPEFQKLFDLFIASVDVGLRKPDPEIYLLTLEKLGLKAHECLFIDDIGSNLKTAKKLGFNVIRVYLGQNKRAVKELEDYTGLDLGSGSSKL